jgi:hypothetical protein
LELREVARRNTRMRFEQWARNPTCEANTISAVHNVRMSKAAESIDVPPTFGQSPFAIARGREFESRLLARGAERLTEALVENQVLPTESETSFIDLRLRMNGGPRVRSLDQALQETAEVLRRAATGAGEPSLVAGATVRIPRGIMLPEAILIIDALVLRGDLTPCSAVVGEIKAYPDLAGYTEPGELASARAQAGLYVHALQIILEELEITEAVAVSTQGFLVLTRPGSDFPSVRAHEDLRYQALRAERGFERLESAAQILPDVVAEGDDVVDGDLIKAVLAAGHAYSEACLSFCDLAPRCHERAIAESDAIILGDDMRRFVAGVTLDRVAELLGGAAPTDDTERDLVRRLHELDAVEAP